jgi:DNA-directed RNA polymerase specialized sigma24 family protein
MHEMPSTVSMDVLVSSTAEINGLSKRWVDDQDTMVDFDLFMDGYDENTRRIASMRYGGMTLKDIADQCGIDKSNVLRRIQHLAEDYHDFSEDPDKKGASNAK